MGNTNLRFGR